MNSNADSIQGQVAQLSPPGEKPVWFTYSSGDRPLDGYTIKRGIGSGGFGEVYYAVSDGGKEVALKQIQRHLDVELRGVSQCLNLKHPNLVVLYDVKQSDRGENWVVMEFVAGENLAEVIERHPNGMPDHEVLSLLRGICDGVSYLHEHGIVHRDLKPGNIFIENNQVKIGDYGLAKFISASRRSGQTESVGTVHYMAPELAHGKYGKEIDLYAVGVIVYEMLTGRVPFHGQSPGEILMKHLTAQPDVSVLPAAFQPIVARLLAKAPEARYPSLEAMLADLDDCLAGRPRAAAPLDRGHHAPRDIGLPPLPGTGQADRPHYAERDAYGPARPQPERRVPSLQFWMDDVHGGLSTAEGMIRFTGDALVLDFRVKPLGMVNMAIQEVRIALTDLDRIRIDEGWFTTKLVVQTTRPQALANLPTSGICQATLRLARNDREAARDFIAGVIAAQCGHVAGGERPITLGAAGFDNQPAGAGAAHAGYEHAHGAARSDRLVRPTDDRVWLGVCSGLAARIGIDPVPIRVLWVLLTVFSGFFMFLFAYLILAMIMPESSHASPIAPGTGRIRRLVRPRHDRKWGGVCSGFAAYFGMDPVWVRVFTVVLTFFTGFIPGLFVYLVLCWAMPEGEPAARSVRRAAEAPAPRGSLSYFGRFVARLPVALLCGGGVGAIVGATCQMMGGLFDDEIAALLGVGSGLLTSAIMLGVLCRGLGWPHAYWPALTTLLAGAGTGLMVGGSSMVRFHGRADDEVAAFIGVGCGLLAAAFVGFTLYASLNRPLGWRWIFVVPFLGVGAGMLTGGASLLLNVREEIAVLVSVGVGLLVAGGLAWMLIFGRWAERLRPVVALADGSSDAGGTGSDLKQTMTYYGPGIANRAMVLGPSLFLIVLCVAWLGAYAAFWLHGTRQPQMAAAFASGPAPVVIDWEVNRFGGHSGDVKALAFDAGGKRLATGDSQGTVRIWDLATNTAVRSLTGHNNEINALAFSPDGSRLAAAANCQDVRVWSTESGDEVSKSIDHPGPVHCVAFSPDGAKLATGSSDDAVRLLDASTGQLVKQFFGCKSDIESVAFLPDGNRLMAVGHNDTHVRMWDISTGRQLKPLSTPNSTPWLKGFIVSPDGRTVAGRDFGGTVYLWETESGLKVGGFSISGGGSGHATLAFGSDGSQVAAIDWQEVKVREVPSGRLLCTFKGHTGTVQSVAMSPDGRHVVSSGTDNTVRMWEVPEALRSTLSQAGLKKPAVEILDRKALRKILFDAAKEAVPDLEVPDDVEMEIPANDPNQKEPAKKSLSDK